jgi:hypothetical protein
MHGVVGWGVSFSDGPFAIDDDRTSLAVSDGAAHRAARPPGDVA